MEASTAGVALRSCPRSVLLNRLTQSRRRTMKANEQNCGTKGARVVGAVGAQPIQDAYCLWQSTSYRCVLDSRIGHHCPEICQARHEALLQYCHFVIWELVMPSCSEMDEFRKVRSMVGRMHLRTESARMGGRNRSIVCFIYTVSYCTAMNSEDKNGSFSFGKCVVRLGRKITG